MIVVGLKMPLRYFAINAAVDHLKKATEADTRHAIAILVTFLQEMREEAKKEQLTKTPHKHK